MPAKAADLRMRFVYDGEPPQPKRIVVDRDATFCGNHGLVDESLLVNAENNGIANVVVHLYTGRRGVDLKQLRVPPPQRRQLTLAIRNCRFEPRIVIARVGDTVVWKTNDPVGHAPNFQFFNRPADGRFVPLNGVRTFQLTQTEPAPIPVACLIHPWEQAHLVVLDHPFAAVSDANGLLEIKDLPENQPLVFRAYHERLSFKAAITVNGQGAAWLLSKFTRTLAADETGVITVKVPPQQVLAVKPRK
jgi:plastocyanin